MDKLEEIKKLKQLLDDGIIDENIAQKLKILGIAKKRNRGRTKKKTKSKIIRWLWKKLMAQVKLEKNKWKSPN